MRFNVILKGIPQSSLALTASAFETLPQQLHESPAGRFGMEGVVAMV